MSDIISFGLKGNDTSEYVEPKKKQHVPVLPSTSTDSIPEDDDDHDNILRELDVDMELDIHNLHLLLFNLITNKS
jgi:hypothetical protein